MIPKAKYVLNAPFATFPGKITKEFGVVEEKNIRYRREMEDGYLFFDGLGPSNNIALACVFDGHGGIGTVRYLEKHFRRIFEKNLQKEKFMEDVLTSTFAEIDIEMRKILDNGATAVVIVIVKENTTKMIYSANCGDARAILVKKDGTGVRLSKDHKVSLPEEHERITKAGGFVAMGRVNAILAVSRAFGDHSLKSLVISTPYISANQVTDADVSVVLGCDGVWDVIEDNEAAACVLKSAHAQEAAGALKDLALKRGTTDNVTAMVVLL